MPELLQARVDEPSQHEKHVLCAEESTGLSRPVAALSRAEAPGAPGGDRVAPLAPLPTDEADTVPDSFRQFGSAGQDVGRGTRNTDASGARKALRARM